MQPDTLDQLAKRIKDILPPGVEQLQGEVEKNIKAVLQAAFKQLDFITRDEFDAQAKVLARTREKLEALEKQVEQLEGQASHNQGE